ncbi:Aminoglycoside N(6')-acetyltransferase type 1 [Frondihabitans sp. 762G35]|uniref:GNAT family N-acetyltransferase n=1 Tax=Frondihabitans sp. 762G35 TaxID=1446794 RepID=UPI000D20D1F3|nr:GNAT family N-acetyltransferase [Frondihabitans sp. 762G35]ARC56552.1 Aminoglycoside N(6')-acetyltransferase type 1 [Frondihabitans sp. 762G35]
MLTFRETDVDEPDAHELLAEYFAERVATFPDPEGYRTTFPDPRVFRAPDGVFLLAENDGDVVGCGGVRRIQAGAEGLVRFEVKHLFVRPTGRGLGLGRRLLGELETRARDFGAREAVLDTNDSLTAAGGLYRSAGYRSIEPYNDNPNATTWYAKALAFPQDAAPTTP